MNPMQELAIKYPTLWDHIAKGGKVRGYQTNLPHQDIIIGNVSSFEDIGCDEVAICIKVADDEHYSVDNIELLPLPKRVPTRDLGKAVNWFDWHSGQIINRDKAGDIFYLVEHMFGKTPIYFTKIRRVVIFRETPPDWWPEELMEDENND